MEHHDSWELIDMQYKKLYVETVKHRIGKRIIRSQIREATKSDIKKLKELHKHGLCDHSIVYDESCWPYYMRRCGVCDTALGIV